MANVNNRVIIFLLLLTIRIKGHTYDYNYNVKQYTRQVVIKQGKLQGVIVEPKVNRDLPPVEQYLGIPYAAAPIGELRFMPPGSAPPWYGVKIADNFGPVCPQKFPDTKNMAPDRKEYFKRLVKFLSKQEEDCLYLNIYAPVQAKTKIKTIDANLWPSTIDFARKELYSTSCMLLTPASFLYITLLSITLSIIFVY